MLVASQAKFPKKYLACVFPANDGLTLLAASIPIGEFPVFKQDPEKQLDEFFQSMPELSDWFREASRESPVKGSGSIPGYQRVAHGHGWALVGDSSRVMDPWSGQGIDQATTHAGYLADALRRWLSEETSWEAAMEQYEQQRRAFSDKTFERASSAAPDFRPMTRAALVKRGYVKR